MVDPTQQGTSAWLARSAVQVVLFGDDRLLSTCFFLCKRHPGDSRIQKPEFLNGIKKVVLSLEAGGKLDVMGFSGYNGYQSVLERWVQVRADMNKRR